jgi:signal transduction histidine kinase
LSYDAKIRVILNNLFGNAVQFQKQESSEKWINLTINVTNNEAVITVEDNGIGIDDKYKTDVFSLFTRATQKNVGSGIGLYMVKEAVEQMGGTIELKSAFNEGTSMKVILPSIA